VLVESPLEVDMIYSLEANPIVKSIAVRPLRIHAPILNRPYYTFDLSYTTLEKRTVYREVKPTNTMVKSDNGKLEPSGWGLISQWCDANGFEYDFSSEADIAEEAHLIQNFRSLMPLVKFGREEFDPELESHLLVTVRDLQTVTSLDVLGQWRNNPQNLVVGHLAKLIYEGKLNASLNTELFSPHTSLSISTDSLNSSKSGNANTND
jgi:hypothetical protein